MVSSAISSAVEIYFAFVRGTLCHTVSAPVILSPIDNPWKCILLCKALDSFTVNTPATLRKIMIVAYLWTGFFSNTHLPNYLASLWRQLFARFFGMKIISPCKITASGHVIKTSLMLFLSVLNWMLLKAYHSIIFPLISSTILIALECFNTFV